VAATWRFFGRDEITAYGADVRASAVRDDESPKVSPIETRQSIKGVSV
jgi:hypothetical protein